MANGSFVFFCQKKNSNHSSSEEYIPQILFCGRFVVFTSINQSITQFFYVKTWDEVASIIHARGSCMKCMTIN